MSFYSQYRIFQIRIDLTQYTTHVLTSWLCWIDMLCRLAQLEICWCIELTCCLTFTDVLTCWFCVESTCWLTFTSRCIDVLVGMLNHYVGWRLLMHWRVGWYVELTCWLTVTVLLNSIIADQLLHLVIKETKKRNYKFIILFRAYTFIKKSITRSLITFKKQTKMTNDFFNHYIFARTFQCTSSECLTNVTITVKVAITSNFYRYCNVS